MADATSQIKYRDVEHMIIDVHMHIVESPGGPGVAHKSLNYGRVETRQGPKTILPPAFSDSRCTAETALAYMDWCGIDKSFLVQGMMFGFQNDAVGRAVKRWPDRFLGLAMVNPGDPRAVTELEILYERFGLRGLKVEVPGLRGLCPDLDLQADTAIPIWEKCEELNIPVMFHLDKGTGNCQDIENIVSSYPELIIMISHLGLSPSPGWKKQVELALHPNVYIELSGLPALFAEEEYPYAQGQEALKWAVNRVGADKVMWGSDMPSILVFCTYPQTLNLVKKHCPFLNQSEKKAILGGNALKIWNMVR